MITLTTDLSEHDIHGWFTRRQGFYLLQLGGHIGYHLRTGAAVDGDNVRRGLVRDRLLAVPLRVLHHRQQHMGALEP